jgi:TPR repeat protein
MFSTGERVGKNLMMASAWFRKAAEQEEGANSQFWLAVHYKSGLGLKSDVTMANGIGMVSVGSRTRTRRSTAATWPTLLLLITNLVRCKI